MGAVFVASIMELFFVFLNAVNMDAIVGLWSENNRVAIFAITG